MNLLIHKMMVQFSRALARKRPSPAQQPLFSEAENQTGLATLEMAIRAAGGTNRGVAVQIRLVELIAQRRLIRPANYTPAK